MNKKSYKIKNKDGSIKRKARELRGFLNYNIATLLNQAELNEYQLPMHHCNPGIMPDYIALNSEPSKFHLTPTTALGFYSFDHSFDKKDGLYNAIYYNDKKLLQSYKEMYKGIRFVIAPDYSLFDDIWRLENESRLFKIRVIMLWFVLEIGAVVIPNAIYLNSIELPMYLSGFEKCTVFCFSTKGHVRRSRERRRVMETVKFVVDNFPLKTILIYSVCGKDETSYRLFEYAISHGIDVKIVDNTMRRRNQALQKKVIKCAVAKL